MKKRYVVADATVLVSSGFEANPSPTTLATASYMVASCFQGEMLEIIEKDAGK
jgi:hypothetical protein